MHGLQPIDADSALDQHTVDLGDDVASDARRKGERRRVAPTWLGVWPAFVLLIIFAWMELVWSGRNIPADLATALIVYSVMTWAGMS